MKSFATVLFIFSGLSAIIAFSNVIQRTQGTEMSQLLGYAVGSFLVPALLLIAGVSLWNKADENRGDDDYY